ncbi:MAG: hypothetical protein FWE90_06025 [Defluviitaleaceae bacterium]|nr:hypothetical protein [Defluviitaleaceae bacterium]
MLNKSLVVAKTNFRNLKLAYIITAIVLGCMLIQDAVFLILHYSGVYSQWDGTSVSIGNYLFLLPILAAVFIPLLNFRKMMNLGAKRTDFFVGCLVNHLVIAAVISLASIIMFLTYDTFMVSVINTGGTLDVVHWFGWIENGAVIAFFQQFAFLFLLASVLHTLSAAQDKWYGWVADVLIVAIIAVFIPIAPLRAALVWFFNLIIFHPNAFAQIAACLGLGLAVYTLNVLLFARKAI